MEYYMNQDDHYPIIVKTSEELDKVLANYEEGAEEDDTVWFTEDWNCITQHWYNEDYNDVFCMTIALLEGTSEDD